jgi:hypothetical protein
MGREVKEVAAAVGVILFAVLAVWFDVAVLHDGDWRCALNEKCVVVKDDRR